MSLYLKYRPQDFQSVVGQEPIKKTLQSALLNNSLSHAYLFCGPRGTGKTSLARILAKRINCLNPIGNEPCNQCNICTAIQQGRLVDLIEIDAASNRGIDEIRELRERIIFSPTQAKAKVYIIDEVHMLTKEAFNALLKTLEEPPSHAYFILATTEAHKIPETIVSRCQQFSFSRISLADITGRLEQIVQAESGESDNEALELIAKLSNGGLRDAIGLLEQMMLMGKVTVEAVSTHLGLTGVNHLERFFKLLEEKDPHGAFEILAEIKSQGRSIPQFLKELIGFMRAQLHLNLSDESKTSAILDFIEAFLKAKEQIDLSPIPELPVEMAIIKACGFYQANTILDGASPKMESESIDPLKTAPARTSEPISPKKQDAAPIQPEVHVTHTETEINPPLSESNLDFESIKKNWPRVLENLSTAFIKVSLMNAELENYTSDTLTLGFKSSTYLQNVELSPNQKEIQLVLKKVFGKPLALKLEMKKVELSTDTLNSQNSAADMAADVFGISK